MVLGQVANAFACRSTVRPAWRIGWTSNRLLLGAIAAELAMLAAFLYLPPLADLLDQAPPTWVGFVIAALAIPAVLAADTVQKAVVRRRRGWNDATRRHSHEDGFVDAPGDHVHDAVGGLTHDVAVDGQHHDCDGVSALGPHVGHSTLVNRRPRWDRDAWSQTLVHEESE